MTMEKEIALELIDEIKVKLESSSPDDRGYFQNILNYQKRASEIAIDMFGENCNHNKIISQSTKLSDSDNIKKIILNELNSMEKVLMFGASADRKLVPHGFEWSLIHADIITVSKDKFEHEHYADSVESAFKEVNTRIKDFYKRRTGQELDGVALMRGVFSLKNPSIVLGDLTTTSGKDVQEGFGHIFAGSMQGIRNPSAHANLKMSDGNAMHLIFLASLLMFTIDDKLK
jgi:uncharacterized protein (TIGR02391 family)